MIGRIADLIRRLEPSGPSDRRHEELSRSLSELVSILFAVVLGIGLSELKGIKILSYDFWVLLLAYIAVILSWWGYHWGIVYGPREVNRLNHLIDCVLVLVYGVLIYIRGPILFVVGTYGFMFVLYLLWELVRMTNRQASPDEALRVRAAASVNGWFSLGMLVFFASACFLKYRGDYVYVQVSAQRGKALIALYVVILLYRVCVHRAYRRRLMDGMPPSITQEGGDRVLVDRAKETAKRARAHLSGFRVGAAILSSNGSVYVGCNLEFDNYSNSIHAEEAALSALVSDSKDGKPVAIAVYTTGEEISWPCGMCRQSLYEQGGSELRVIACNDVTSEEMKIGDLLPKAFHL